MKKCIKCNETKPLSEFHRVRSNRTGYKATCKECTNLKYAGSPETQLKAKKNWLRSRFGIEYEDYVAMIEQQDNKCAICGREERRRWRNKDTRALAVDHDHESGQIRGLLCADCNTAIGLMQDDVALLAKAIDYLQSHRLKIVA